jgi:hypothetical protein
VASPRVVGRVLTALCITRWCETRQAKGCDTHHRQLVRGLNATACLAQALLLLRALHRPLRCFSSMDGSPMTERRRWPRREVTWAVFISVDGSEAVTAKAIDASRHGLRVERPTDLSTIPEGARCEVDVRLAGGQARFVRVCEVRHSGEHGLGLFVPEPLPAALVPVVDNETEDLITDSFATAGRRTSSLVGMVRSVMSAAVEVGRARVSGPKGANALNAEAASHAAEQTGCAS